ncbi:MAG: ABC transporter permease [Ruminococcus sp.]|jgi:ABC-type antimicrobial peptide transport system permease subunit
MRFWDLIRMSLSNLWRRKLRTFLTILGVMIGTASIVVMVSLGLALDKTTMETMESSGGLTTIQVYENGMFMDMSSDSGEETTEEQKKITDDTIEELERIPHVTLVSPVLNLQILGKQGRYIGNLDVYGMSREALESMNLSFASGQIPKEGDGLSFIYGNQVTANFYNESSGEGYWDSGEMPDVDLNKPVYYIFDQDSYWNSQNPSETGGEEGEESPQPVKPPKKYILPTAGVLAGDINTYTEQSYGVYCDVEELTAQLKRVFKNKAIPGQPVTKSGKPYKEIYYNQAYVKIDDMDYAESVQNEIKNLGYTPNWNAEWVKAQQKQYQSIQLVLGGIGAVSLFVAAIGIANTMMMSIYERTKEIGILKVLGCSLSNIRSMFLAEASAIGLCGGIAGLILSSVISWALNNFGAALGGSITGMAEAQISYIPFWLAGLALIFAVLVGMVAGFFPALRAMRLSPLAAIRNE